MTTVGCGRYAPSPTGPLHLGNLQTALAAWLQARLHGMEFILRMEDLDGGRCRPNWAEGIVSDLRRLGIDWDVGPGVSEPAEYLQSLRLDHYRAALDHLSSLDRLFPCRCTRRDLRELASAPHGPLGAVYPGTCRRRPLPSQRPWREAGATPDSVRLRMDSGFGRFEDLVCGSVECDFGGEVGDTVVYRRDGVFAYHLAVVVDDIAGGVSDVVRGADLVWSTFPQLSLYRALGAVPPRYRHVPLRVDERGRRMSKRTGSPGLEQVLARGTPIDAVVGDLAAGLGLVEPGQRMSAADLLRELDPARFDAGLRRAGGIPDQDW